MQYKSDHNNTIVLLIDNRWRYLFGISFWYKTNIIFVPGSGDIFVISHSTTPSRAC